MENNIPTSEEFYDKCYHEHDLISYQELAYDAMKRFAAMHVKAALEAVKKDVTFTAHYEDWKDDELVINEDNYEGSYSQPYLSKGKVLVIDEKSILNAYPETNIK